MLSTDMLVKYEFQRRSVLKKVKTILNHLFYFVVYIFQYLNANFDFYDLVEESFTYSNSITGSLLYYHWFELIEPFLEFNCIA